MQAKTPERPQTLWSDTEFQSALVRLAIASLVAVYLGWATYSGYHPIAVSTFVGFFIVYMGFVLALLLSIVLVQGVPWRPYVAIFADTMAANMSVYLTDVTHSPLFLTYIWIIVTQGTRYGRDKLRAAAVFSLIGYCTVLIVTDEFRNRPLEALIQVTALVALPLYLNSMLLKLTRARREAEVANRAKGDFLARMTHEIRTPLTGVMGLSRLLEDTRLSRAQRKLVDSLNASARALRALIDDVLDFSKIEAGKLEIVSRPFSPRLILEESVLTLVADAREKGLDIRWEAEDGVPESVRGDGNRIREVLLNLLSNALKFTESGHIRASVSCAEHVNDSVRLRFEVRDTGIGIPEERMEEMFESFTQLDPWPVRRYGGTGLGTTIARDLVARMGGELRVQSTVGEGSRFWFELELPVSTAPAGAKNKVGSRWPGVRVLVGEDDPISARVVESFLERLGCQTETASDGDEVLEKLADGHFDLVLMDMQMPATDGLSATRQWRGRERDGHVPIIALTANATVQDQKACLSAGMDGFVTKPVEPDALAEILGQWLGPGISPGSDPSSRDPA